MPDPPTTFRQLVLQMRALQKAEAREPSRSSRRAALKLELRVDAWLERHADEIAQQAELLTEDENDA
jgi:hypothetical protein